MTSLRHRSQQTVALAALLLAAPALAVEEDAGFSSFLELRVYSALDERARDRFLEYFEEHYLESQEVVGMRIWAQFRDLETPSQFVWLRGYRDMESRAEGLMSFYTSPVWEETSPEVGTMLAGASHVHFLEPVKAADGFAADLRRPTLLSEEPERERPGVVVVQVFLVEEEPFETVIDDLRDGLISPLVAAGAGSLGLFRSSEEPNNIPQLPYIEDEPVVVWFASFQSARAYEQAQAMIEIDRTPMEVFVLKPGSRSRLYHRAATE